MREGRGGTSVEKKYSLCTSFMYTERLRGEVLPCWPGEARLAPADTRRLPSVRACCSHDVVW